MFQTATCVSMKKTGRGCFHSYFLGDNFCELWVELNRNTCFVEAGVRILQMEDISQWRRMLHLLQSKHWKSGAINSMFFCCLLHLSDHLLWELLRNLILLAGGCAFSWYIVQQIWYPSVCFQQLDLRWNVLCNMWAIWQLLIKWQYAHPLCGL